MLQVVVMVVHVGRREVLQRVVVVVRVMGSHGRGATVISGHHFGNIWSSRATESHAPIGGWRGTSLGKEVLRMAATL